MTRQFKKQFENQSQTEYMQNNQPQTICGEEEKQNSIKTQSQSGRSMIEMLGVLAIIAILSIGGIVGYKLAMNYYQADQIANEINLMRNDLKVKYALGNEELLLGDPYDETPDDENYSGHLSTQYDRYPVDYDCIRKDKTEFYNCREADAYYIKVGNVSKGVCKPLTTLVNAMDGLMYIKINKQPYIEDDLCSSDENNEFYIQFDAADVNGNYDSNRPEGWCAKNDDCDASRPICDIENNECVECTEDTDCSNNKPICNVDLGNCEPCPPEKPKWNGEECVECLSSADCKNLNKPNCNTGTNTCEACPPEKPVWYNNTCVECETDEDCLAKGTDEPICNNETNMCEPCPDGQQWKESAQGCVAYECRTNEDCNPDGGFEKYCYYKNLAPKNNKYEWSDGESVGGICKEVSNAFQGSIQLNGNTYYGSRENMTWWSACRLCAARKHEEDSICESSPSGTTAEPDFMLDISGLNCNPSCNSHQEHCTCYKDQATNTLADSVIKLRGIWGCTETSCNPYPWLSNSYSSDRVRNLNLKNGDIHTDHRFGVQGSDGGAFGDYAVCR